MIKKHHVIVMALAVLSNSAWSAVNIVAPADVHVMAIDTQDIKTGLLGTQQHEFKVDAGEHQLHVRYEQFFNHPHSDEHEIIKSDVLVIETPALLDGEQYYLAVPKQFKDVDEARTFAKNPKIFLKNQRGEVVAEQSYVQVKQPILTAGLFSRSYDLTKKKTNTVQKSSSETPTVSQKTTKNTAKGQQLIDMWSNSSSADREAFLIWLNQQGR